MLIIFCVLSAVVVALVGAFNVSTVAGGLLLLYKGTVDVDDVDVGAVAPILVAGREKKM